MEGDPDSRVKETLPENGDGKCVGDQACTSSDMSGQSTDRSDSRSTENEADPRANRLKLFNKVMEKSLESVIQKASFHRFAKSFHPFYKQKPQLTEGIHKQFVSELRTSIQDDIKQIIEEGQLQCKLEELDRLTEESRDRTEPAWRPSGVPEQDLCSFVMPFYLRQQEFLRRELKKLQKENASLAKKVQVGRDRIAETEQHIASSVEECRALTVTQDTLASLSSMQNFDNV